MKSVHEEWARAWQKIMPDYDRSVYEEFSSSDNREFLRLLGKYVREGTLVLEAGCGYGHKCVLFSKYYKASVVGIDIVLGPLKTLMSYLSQKSSVPGLQVLVVGGDVTKLPFHNSIFDVITSFGVIEHFRNESEVIAALSEARRVLKVGGHLIIIIPNFAATFRNKLVIALTRGRFGMHHRPYTRSALVTCLKMIKGMQVVEDGFLPFGFRSLILSMVKSPSIEKVICFLYHAVWHILDSMLKIVGDEYQNPIYLVAKRTR
jgi:ubiquinone/menaquinone biosynthesis C-methylase UbiE